MESTRFVVEGAGCSSCAARIGAALEPLGTVQAIEVDEEADTAAVVLVSQSPLSEDAISRALQGAASGSGHEYRVQPRSWLAARA